MKLSKNWQALVGSAVLALATVTSFSAAANLKSEMRAMGGSVSAALKTDDSQTFIQSLQQFSAAVEQAKQQPLPYSLHDKAADSSEVADYKQGFQTLLDTAKQAIETAEKGDLPQAKQQAEQLLEIRNGYHKKYK
ncbi:soluble cytochrome b562 [Pasteurella testudinis DSM 23072]|uniref:Soluble cytochrome b562 n=1 Tax=Pasteurella testudinis DSM 23072 TaxID=1122938 RepID=A0A1W1V9S0_9PAST|nr:cytochrome b562 [Pasteurella testudinis]SMB90023.1 soluble cytochrome b562 [Pasteurella testudinis DSM 23072]SUB51314.1 cytochrome b562 family protein [Pasteurella testudinis]